MTLFILFPQITQRKILLFFCFVFGAPYIFFLVPVPPYNLFKEEAICFFEQFGQFVGASMINL
jgi:hypothetical protein